MANIQVQNVRSIYYEPQTRILFYSAQADPDDVTPSVVIIDFDSINPEFRLGQFTNLNVHAANNTGSQADEVEFGGLFSLATNPDGQKLVVDLPSEEAVICNPNSDTIDAWALDWEFPIPIFIRPKTQQFQLELPPAESNVADTGIYIVSWGIHIVE